MAAESLRMRQVRDVMKIKFGHGLTHRQIALACGMGTGTVSECLARARGAGLSWPLPEGLDDVALEQLLYPPPDPTTIRTAPDLAWGVRRELPRPGVTLQQWWIEYKQDHSDGYGYSRFCERYHAFRSRLQPTMRQVHRAGENSFVEFSGRRLEIMDRATGELHPVELFVGALVASSYFYAEVTPKQELVYWIVAHARSPSPDWVISLSGMRNRHGAVGTHLTSWSCC